MFRKKDRVMVTPVQRRGVRPRKSQVVSKMKREREREVNTRNRRSGAVKVKCVGTPELKQLRENSEKKDKGMTAVDEETISPPEGGTNTEVHDQKEG